MLQNLPPLKIQQKSKLALARSQHLNEKNKENLNLIKVSN